MTGPPLLWRRVAAFALDFIPVALVLDLATGLSDAGILAVTSLWVLISATVLSGPTPGKRILGLVVEGTGCRACRELRRLWPILALSFFAFGLEAAAGSGHVPSSGFVLIGTLALILGMVVTHLWPLARGKDFHHDKATGFRVTFASHKPK